MNAIVAVTPSWAIGKQGGLLFSLHEDMMYFRRITMGKTMIMGRKTLESFPGGRPLPKRRNIVLTRDPFYTKEGVEVVRTVEEAAELVRDLPEDEVFVIGGGETYRQLLPYCSKVYVTHIDQDTEAEVFFPDLSRIPGWELTSLSEPITEGPYSYRFGIWEKKTEQ